MANGDENERLVKLLQAMTHGQISPSCCSVSYRNCISTKDMELHLFHALRAGLVLCSFSPRP
jgi:hypothetical protein